MNINFIGQVSNQELPNLYNRFKFLFYVLNMKESKTLLEAMSSGCIVIGTNVEGVNSIIKNNHNGFLINTQMGDIEKVLR